MVKILSARFKDGARPAPALSEKEGGYRIVVEPRLIDFEWRIPSLYGLELATGAVGAPVSRNPQAKVVIAVAVSDHKGVSLLEKRYRTEFVGSGGKAFLEMGTGEAINRAAHRALTEVCLQAALDIEQALLARRP